METTPQSQLDRDCLVAVVTNDADLRRFREEGWYRVPARSVGRAVAAETLAGSRVLALYQTAGIGDGLPSAVEMWGEIDAIERRTRREILPREPDHPAADEPYHVIRVKSVERLERPIVARRPRRVTFIRTTRERLLHAADVNDLIVGTMAEEHLWLTLRGLDAERKFYMRARDVVMEVDFAVFQNDRVLGIITCDDESYSATAPPLPERWSVLRFSPSRLESDLGQCLDEILAMVRQMRSEGQEVAPAVP